MKLLLLTSEAPEFLRVKDQHVQAIKKSAPELDIALVSEDDKEKIAEHILDADIVAGVHRSTADLISQAKRVRWVHAFSAGVDRILTKEIVQSEIIVSNSSGIHAVPIAEHVIGFMLVFARKFAVTFKLQQEKKWEKQEDLTELRDKRLVIVGFGSIGREIGRLASGFSMKISAVDVNIQEKPDWAEELVGPDKLSALLPTADFVVSALPLAPATRGFFSEQQFSDMKDTAVFINIGRGGVVDQEALIDALRAKKIGGAGLDVTDPEPLPKDSPLWEMDNVVITPHHSGWSEKYMDRAVDLFISNLKAFLDQKELPTLVNKEQGF